MKREKLLKDLNLKIYAEEIIMNPLVNNIVLSSGRSKMVLPFL